VAAAGCRFRWHGLTRWPRDVGWKIVGPESVSRLVSVRAKGRVVRKFSVVVGATVLALAGAACGSQSTTTAGTAAIAASAAPVSWGGPVNPPSARSIVGTWTGYITPFPGSGASRQRLMVVVAGGERAGTWRIGSRCAGTLRLKDISSGYHHYYRVAGANAGCAALGIDCLKRVGAQMLDVFVPNSGPDASVDLGRMR
jgi:hypothetical protein